MHNGRCISQNRTSLSEYKVHQKYKISKGNKTLGNKIKNKFQISVPPRLNLSKKTMNKGLTSELILIQHKIIRLLKECCDTNKGYHKQRLASCLA